MALPMRVLTENRYSTGTDLSALSCPEGLLQKEPIEAVSSDKVLGPKY